VKSFGSVSFGVVCCCGSCVTIFVFGTATVRVTVLASGFAIFLASATRLLLVPSINSSAAHFVSLATVFVSNPLVLHRCVVFISCKLDLFINLCNQLATTNSDRTIALKWIKSNETQCIKYSHNSLLVN